MTSVDIVPQRRLPRLRSVLTYLCPDDLLVEPGCLVRIPFRGRTMNGLIWGTSSSVTPKLQLSSIGRPIIPYPILTAWQLTLLRHLKDADGVSPTDLLVSLLPATSVAAFQRLLPSARPRPALDTATITPLKLWYRDRQTALDEMTSWVKTHRSRVLVIICPTQRDALELNQRLTMDGLMPELFHSQLTPLQHLRVYVRVLTGRSHLIVGTQAALLLPFPTRPVILIDQEEHPNHKQSARFPRLDTVAIIRSLCPEFSWTSPSPSLAAFAHDHPTVPPPAEHRLLVDLQQRGTVPWIAPETEEIIDRALRARQRVVCIVPKTGYATMTLCAACQQVFTCPHCRQVVTLYRGSTTFGSCRHCGRRLTANWRCPNCGGIRWRTIGLGIDQLRELCQQRWPQVSVASVVQPDAQADIAIDTYQAYAHLGGLPNLGPVIIISGDGMLNIPDYAVGERTWAYLARLQAQHPTGPIVVQTWQPSGEFWQRWRFSLDQPWYAHELQVRKRLHLPPSRPQWIAYGQVTPAEAKTTGRKLSDAWPGQLTATALPPKTGRLTRQRVLLTWTPAIPRQPFPFDRFFDRRWQVDTSPRSWLD